MLGALFFWAINGFKNLDDELTDQGNDVSVKKDLRNRLTGVIIYVVLLYLIISFIYGKVIF